MNPYKEKLIGSLIGIARATDGNDHLITAESTEFILHCLTTEPESQTEFQSLMIRAEEVKRNMVPDCFLCANPCGRTAAYELAQLNLLAPDVREKKLQLLDCLIMLSKSGKGKDSLFYRGLIVTGMEDYPEEALQCLLQEAENELIR